MSADSLGDRMKEYESVPRTRLTRRVPVMMRLDGKAFHTFTRDMPKPYCQSFQKAMWAAAKYLCENIQGAQLAYIQSDEISVLITDYAGIKTEAWYDYQIQKMVSVAAAMCSVAFDGAYQTLRFTDAHIVAGEPWGALPIAYNEVFDCRVWNLPKEEVCNAFIWRQQDATRNAIQSLGQHELGHKAMQGLSNAQVQEKLFQEKGINFNDLPMPQRRGVCVVKKCETVPVSCPDKKEGCAVLHTVERTRWVVDENIPVFTQDRDYVERHL